MNAAYDFRVHKNYLKHIVIGSNIEFVFCVKMAENFSIQYVFGFFDSRKLSEKRLYTPSKICNIG
jgi:hypothetical protein